MQALSGGRRQVEHDGAPGRLHRQQLPVRRCRQAAMVDLECRRLERGMQAHDAKGAPIDIGQPVCANPDRRSIGDALNRSRGRKQVPLQLTNLEVGMVAIRLAPDA